MVKLGTCTYTWASMCTHRHMFAALLAMPIGVHRHMFAALLAIPIGVHRHMFAALLAMPIGVDRHMFAALLAMPIGADSTQATIGPCTYIATLYTTTHLTNFIQKQKPVDMK